MLENDKDQSSDFVALAADIVSAYVSKNSVPAGELAGLLVTVHSALQGLNGTTEIVEDVETFEKPTPAQVRKSLSPDSIVSFVDGKSYKTLKRHLGTHGLDPYSYRQRYGLPSDYPMVAPNYAAQRSALAKSIGLGRPGGRVEESEEDAKPRGRRKVA